MNLLQIAARIRAHSLFVECLLAVINQRIAEGRPTARLLVLLNNPPPRYNHT